MYLKSIQRQIVGVVLAVAMLGWGLGVAPQNPVFIMDGECHTLVTTL